MVTLRLFSRECLCSAYCVQQCEIPRDSKTAASATTAKPNLSNTSARNKWFLISFDNRRLGGISKKVLSKHILKLSQ